MGKVGYRMVTEILQFGEIGIEIRIFSIVCKKAFASLYTITITYCAFRYA